LKDKRTAMFTRRTLITTASASLITPAFSRLELDITRGNFRPIPIAVADFQGDPELAGKISLIIEANLKRSGYFVPIDRAAFIEKNISPDQTPNYASWQTIKAEGLVTGRVARQSDGRMAVNFRLWDIADTKQLAGQQFATGGDNWRRVGHIISDQVFEKITGSKGHFDTRIVFVDETGPRDKRRKRLALMDQDGANVSYLTKGDDLVLTPRFSPNSQDITYMAFNDGNPRVFLLNLETRQRESVGNFPGMTFSPRFAPDGQRVVMSMQQGNGSSLYQMDLRSKGAMKLTDGSAIDTSPSFSPDGSQIVFESDRGGSQQLYVMPAGGGGAKRISFASGRYGTPVWSPRGDYIAFTKTGGGQFMIGIMKPDGSGERIITTGFHNEGPTWSPNGLFIMFFRENAQGSQLFMADITGRNEQRVPTPSSASDPAWSPTLR
jgi:TolB protein